MFAVAVTQRSATRFGDPAPRSELAPSLLPMRAVCELCAEGSVEEAIGAVGPGFRWLEYCAEIDATPLAVAASRSDVDLLAHALGHCCVEPQDAAAAQALEKALESGSAPCAWALVEFGVKLDLRLAFCALVFDGVDFLRKSLGRGKAAAINRRLGAKACEQIFERACSGNAVRCAEFLIGLGLDWSNVQARRGLRALAQHKQDAIVLLALRQGSLLRDPNAMRIAQQIRPDPFQVFFDHQALAGVCGECCAVNEASTKLRRL